MLLRKTGRVLPDAPVSAQPLQDPAAPPPGEQGDDGTGRSRLARSMFWTDPKVNEPAAQRSGSDYVARASRFDSRTEWPRRNSLWADAALACLCPCVALGRVSAQLGRAEPADRCGVRVDGGCARTCCLAAALGPLSAAAVAVHQRAQLMSMYGFEPSRTEAAKGACYPVAILQHMAFLTAADADDALRWPWESAATSTGAQGAASATFDVVVIGPPRCGVSSFVRAMVGAPAAAPAAADADADALGRPTMVAVGTRVLARGQPPAVFHFWDAAADADVCAGRSLFETADAVVVVFNPDLRESLDDALRVYCEAFAGAPEPKTRVLCGNVRANRREGDTCEFGDAVSAAGEAAKMHVAMLALQAPSAAGSKKLLDFLVDELWWQRYAAAGAHENRAEADIGADA